MYEFKFVQILGEALLKNRFKCLKRFVAKIVVFVREGAETVNLVCTLQDQSERAIFKRAVLQVQ